MAKKPLISIIMPVYKVEEYVGRAIESMQAQTCTDWELWAVDDRSPDKSGEICESYAAMDPRIRVLHKENGGAPSARNMAMEQAQGKYFYFMDSDDWAEPGMLADMLHLAETNASQLVIAGYYTDVYYSETQKHTGVYAQPGEVFDSQQDFRKNAYRFFDLDLLYTPWNKLYLAQYLKDNNIFFPNTFWDDFPFNLAVIKDVERVSVTGRSYYHFIRKRAESETSKYNPKMYEKREEEHRWMQGLYQYWGIDDAPSREFVSRRYLERLLGCIENHTSPKCTLTKQEKLARIRKMITSPACREALRYARPHTLMVHTMLVPVRLSSTWLTYLEGTFLSFVRTRNNGLFMWLRAHR